MDLFSLITMQQRNLPLVFFKVFQWRFKAKNIYIYIYIYNYGEKGQPSSQYLPQTRDNLSQDSNIIFEQKLPFCLLSKFKALAKIDEFLNFYERFAFLQLNCQEKGNL